MLRIFTRKYSIATWGLGILLGAMTVAFGQENRTINVGNMLYETNEAFTADNIQWPRQWGDILSIYGQNSRTNTNVQNDRLDMLHCYGMVIGTVNSWSDLDGVPHELQVAQVAQSKFSDLENIVVAVRGAFKRTYRNPYPSKTLDIQNWTPVLAELDNVENVNPNLPADVVIYNEADAWPRLKTEAHKMGINIKRWVYGFANKEYEDFVIQEFVFTNTASTARNGTYFGLVSETSASAFYPADVWGDYYGIDYWKHPNAGGSDATADSMRLWYSWDGYNQEELDYDSWAHADGTWGNFEEPQYMSFIVVHADKSVSDESDDPRQPVKAGWSQRELSPNLLESTHEIVYEFISEGWDPNNPGAYAEFVDENKVVTDGGMYRKLKDGYDLYAADATAEQEKTALFSFGPYDMAAGDDVRIVVAYAGGTIPQRWAIDVGRAYDNGSASLQPIEPLPYDITDLDGNVIAAEGTTLDEATKNQIIALGKDYAFNNAAKAISVWKNGTVKNGAGSFGIPFAPASPSLTGTSQPLNSVLLEWGDEAANDTKTGTISAYRIYRAVNRSTSLTSPYDTTHILLDEVESGVREYTDDSVSRGEDYWYYVTAVNSDGVESSVVMNRTGTAANRSDEALSPTREPEANWQDEVVVVPNPYHAVAANKYSGRRLVFLNLPGYAKIHIYTMTGDKVQTLEHNSGAGDLDWEDQDTFATMEVVSGVYIYVVEEYDGPPADPGSKATGEKAIKKFIVIK